MEQINFFFKRIRYFYQVKTIIYYGFSCTPLYIPTQYLPSGSWGHQLVEQFNLIGN